MQATVLGQINTRNEAFVDVVESLRTQVISKDSGLYVEPTAAQRQSFRQLADSFQQAQQVTDLDGLVADASSLGYEVVVVEDGADTFFGLTEKLYNGQQTLGWGSYFTRQGDSRNAVLQAIHPLADINTAMISANAFVDSQAYGFFMAGAHRNANGQGSADVGHLADSILNEVHQSFTENGNSAWQVHGFNIDNHSEFPNDTAAIFSNGTGTVTERLFGLDDAFEASLSQLSSYVFNTLDVDDPQNVTVNGDVDGEMFRNLAGATNIQQRFSSSIGVPFVHIELEQSLRIDGGEANHLLASNAISQAIIATTPMAVPEPGVISLVLLGMCMATIHRRRE